jgi:hypothetical protein
MASFYSRIVERVFGPEISKRVSAASLSAIRALDDVRDRSLTANTYPRDRHDYDRDEVLRDALEAWRVNPLARRIVELTSQYVVGGGIAVSSKHTRTHKFLQEWWKHRLNRLEVRCFDWCDELTRSGELFIVVSTDLAGMSYVRAIPAAEIQEIETSENDVEQELIIWEKPRLDGGDIRRSDRPGPQGILSGKPWKVYNELTDHLGESGEFEPVMLHYAVNRPVGAKRGESDLAPLLRWLSRYAAWLEDRARLNRYRNTFIFWVKARFNNQADRLARQAELNTNPPNPGSILVTDETEDWSVLSPKLESHEAGEDGLAIKKMIAAGSANPMHFLAEPEGSTRTTAESAGGPTYRHYEQRQLFFLWAIQDLARVIVKRRKMVDRSVNVEAELQVTGPDISARDNAALATAASVIVASMTTMRDRGLIDDMELLRIVYRFAGEVIDLEDVLKRGQAAPKTAPPGKPAGEASITNERVKVDPFSGEPKGMAQ